MIDDRNNPSVKAGSCSDFGPAYKALDCDSRGVGSVPGTTTDFCVMLGKLLHLFVLWFPLCLFYLDCKFFRTGPITMYLYSGALMLWGPLSATVVQIINKGRIPNFPQGVEDPSGISLSMLIGNDQNPCFLSVTFSVLLLS